MTFQAKIESNRRNSLKSTGPRTPEGLSRSSMNGLKHGLRSKKLALMREESLAFENRKLRWLAHSDPVDDMAEFLVYQNVCLSFEIERLKLIQLLGRRLGEARSDRLVAQILAASHALDPLADTNPFDDLLNDMPGSAKD